MQAQQPQTTVEQLCEIFPTFREWWHDEQRPSEDGLVDGIFHEWSHHEVLREFLEYFSGNHKTFNRKQLSQFGVWIDNAISTPTALENAVSTCFLEHTRQVKINRVLAPYLSRKAKRG